MNDKIYPSMVIRTQAEAIELLEKENQQLKEENTELKIKLEDRAYEELKVAYEKVKEENEQLKEDCEDLFNQKEMMFKNMQLNQLKVCELAKVLDEIRKYINKNKYFYSGLQNEDREIGLFENEINDLLQMLDKATKEE